MHSKPQVFVGLPNYDGRMMAEQHMALNRASTQGYVGAVSSVSYSILTASFNMLMASALNCRGRGITHFLLLHDDIIPEDGFLDKMMGIMKEKEADILSVVSPVKNKKGLASMALDGQWKDNDPEWRVRRLTLKELHKDYPPTFTLPNLLVNTGCMLVDLSKPFAHQCWFEFKDKLIFDPKDGMYKSVSFPEDWNYCRMARKLGASIWATREIYLRHCGRTQYDNGEWGLLSTDEDT